MKRRVLQFIANSVINRMGKSNDKEEIQMYFDMGMKLNAFSVDYFDIYLD